MEILAVGIVILLAVWLLGLHRPIQSAASSLTALAEAGEIKSHVFTASVKAEAVKTVNGTDFPTEEEVTSAKSKLEALNSLSL